MLLAQSAALFFLFNVSVACSSCFFCSCCSTNSSMMSRSFNCSGIFRSFSQKDGSFTSGTESNLTLYKLLILKICLFGLFSFSCISR